MENNPHTTTKQLPEIIDLTDAVQETGGEYDPRQQLIDSVLEPYHIHYTENVEGHEMNPEAAERNFDILLVVTDMIRTRSTTFITLGDETGEDRWTSEPKYAWFFEKHAETGVKAINYSDPSKIVRAWLEKLGPHNDLADAEVDLLKSRAWLQDVINTGTTAERDTKNTQKEANLIAELDIELYESRDDESGDDELDKNKPKVEKPELSDILSESAAYLEKYISQMEERGSIDKATIGRMKLSSVRIELARLRHMGTHMLTTGYTSEQYTDFEESVDDEIDSLGVHFATSLETALQQYNGEPDPKLTPKQIESRENEFKQVTGALFETFSYLRAMENILIHKGLAIEKFRPGTLREESGTAHKISQVDGNNTQGFNFNFDFRYDTLKTNPQVGYGEGIYHTVYYQNKVDIEYAPSDKAELASQKFFAGKEFRFVIPENIMEDVSSEINTHDTRNMLIQEMLRWARRTHELEDTILNQ